MCVSEGAIKCCSVRASFHQGDTSRGECLKSPDIMGWRKGNCLVAVVVYWNYVAFISLFHKSCYPRCASSPCPVSFSWNRHTHAQLVLRRLQARAVCPAFIWSCDQVRVLLCQYGVRLWGTLPALPTAELRYRRAFTHSTSTHWFFLALQMNLSVSTGARAAPH